MRQCLKGGSKGAGIIIIDGGKCNTTAISVFLARLKFDLLALSRDAMSGAMQVPQPLLTRCCSTQELSLMIAGSC
jgi:hypothetical protein